jgi:mono/diheme cytochrome c family protein
MFTGKRNRCVAIMSFLLVVFTASACRRDMQDQPKYTPLQPSSFFPDGRSARPIPQNTIARGHLDDDDAFHLGAVNGTFLDTVPLALSRPMLDRGRQRYEIYCAPCHSSIGDGNGMIARRGFKNPANFHSDRLRQAPPGYIFQVITNGYGAMPDYSNQINVNDRWAIVAYIKALQLSRNATAADVPPEAKSQLGPQ